MPAALSRPRPAQAATQPAADEASTPAAIKIIHVAVALLLALAGALAVSYGGTPTAQAATADRVDDLKINYVVDEDGVLHVKETWVWRFGSDSGRHGLQRELVTREPDADNPGKDMVYDIADFEATSPDDVSTNVQEIPVGDDGDRDRSTVYRIGSTLETIDADTATYLLTYDVRGSLRSFADYDELYWDATGFDAPEIDHLSINARVPGGAQDVTCNVGEPGSTSDCDSAKVGGSDVAEFAQSKIPARQNVTIGVKIKSGLIMDNEPHLVRKAGLISRFLDSGLLTPTIVLLLISVAIPVVGITAVKIKLADQRYLDLAPGTVPAAGESSARIGRDNHPKIPVRFDPPPISVAEASLLLDGQIDGKDTTATLVDLAARGSLRFKQTGLGLRVEKIKPVSGAAPHEASLFDQVFKGGRVVTLKKYSLAKGHDRVRKIVRGMAESRNWFTTVPTASSLGDIRYLLIPGWIVGGTLAAVGFNDHPLVLLFLLPLIASILTGMKMMLLVRRGQRTADGRAVVDQVDGFRKYLKTAEADQLKFEEGEDIFSKYLPWAIIFGLTKRWQRVCGQLIADGRLPDQSPAWYGVGDGRFASFNLGVVSGAVSSAARQESSGSGSGSGGSSSGTGFGSGGSSFSGSGGFSGGGGGGGGASSW